jgi:histone acetyltransferase MYST1
MGERKAPLTMAIGEYVFAKCPELGEVLEAKIVRLNLTEHTAYIHFCHEDRRYDRWVSDADLSGGVTHKKRKPDKRNQDHKYDGNFERIHREVTQVKNIPWIKFGAHSIITWYYSPYPPEVEGLPLYICDKCCRYFTDKADLRSHERTAKELKPPGREVYRKDQFSVFQIHGRDHKITGQCLCLLCKLFLDHKTLCYDIGCYVFYVLCECDQTCCHIAAFFSKQRSCAANDIISCIVVLPPFQRRGYGSLLISVAYEIARRGDVIGGPERPLSQLGQVTFERFWKDEIMELFALYGEKLRTVDLISKMTSFRREEVELILKKLQIVKKYDNEKALEFDFDALDQRIREFRGCGKRCAKIDPNYFIWLPNDEFSEYYIGDPESEFQTDDEAS